MATHPHHPEAPVAQWIEMGAPARRTPGLIVIGRQLLLVPEAVVLLAVLCLHMALGAPLATALLGLAVVVWFGCRTALLVGAQRAFGQGSYSRLDALARVALWLHPYSADGHLLRGRAYLARGQADAAEAAFRLARAYYPGHPMVHVELAATLLELGRPGEARQEAACALRLDPRCAAAYTQLASAEQALGAPAGVAEALVRAGLAVVADPDDEAILRGALARLLVAQGQHTEAQLALAGIGPLLESCPVPYRAALHFQLGEIYRAGGDAQTARAHFSASETLDPHGRYAAAAWRAARS